MRAALIYPHQLFTDQPALRGADVCLLVEEPLLLTQYRFHCQKLILHRASLQHYADGLRRQKRQVRYVECGELNSTGDVAGVLTQLGVTHVQFVDPCDDWLEQRLTAALTAARLEFTVLDDPHFLTPWPVIEEYAAGRKRLFFTDFYVLQRKRLGLLLDERGRPLGGKWSYDPENRRKLPRDAAIPPIAWPASSAAVRKAQDYVRTQFPRASGAGDPLRYPVTAEQARAALDDFLDNRFAQFGEYEDAIHAEQAFLFHAVLTPALNIGLIGMSQHADGSLITTKPYLSGSSYILKMSNFRKGPWCMIWDALYWRFVDRHRDFFAANPRMSVMVAQCERMGSRLDEHRRTAEQFLARLHGE